MKTLQFIVDGIYARVVDAVEYREAGKGRDLASPLKTFSLHLSGMSETIADTVEWQVRTAIERTWPGRFDFQNNWRLRVLPEPTGYSTYGWPANPRTNVRELPAPAKDTRQNKPKRSFK